MEILSGRALVGKTLQGRYRLDAFVGKGGMSWVFRGLDLHSQIPVAVKVLLPHLVEEARVRARFEDEGRYQSRLQHMNIVQVYDVFSEGTVCAIVMEWIAGEDLRDLLKRLRQSIPLTEIWHLMSAILDAMSHAHSRSLIHRDLKPSNILLHEENTRMIPKVADFGIAKAIDEQEEGLTRTGASLGTLKYMAPEQFLDSKHVDQRADIYSLGVLLFLLLTGRLPFRGDSQVVLYKQMHEGPPSPRSLNPEISEFLEQILLRCLATSPDQRYASCDELSRVLSLAMIGEFGMSIPDYEGHNLAELREIIREYLLELGDATAVGDMQGFAVGTMLYQSFIERPKEKESPDGLPQAHDVSGGALSSLQDSSSDASLLSPQGLDVPQVAFHQANVSLRGLSSLPRITGGEPLETTEFPPEDLQHHAMPPQSSQPTQAAMVAFQLPIDPQSLLDSSFQNKNAVVEDGRTFAQGFQSPFADAPQEDAEIWPQEPHVAVEKTQASHSALAYATTLGGMNTASLPPELASLSKGGPAEASWEVSGQASLLSSPQSQSPSLLGAHLTELEQQHPEKSPLLAPSSPPLFDDSTQQQDTSSLFRKPERRSLFQAQSEELPNAPKSPRPAPFLDTPNLPPAKPHRIEIPPISTTSDRASSPRLSSPPSSPKKKARRDLEGPAGPHLLWWVVVGFCVILLFFGAALWAMSGEREVSVEEPPFVAPKKQPDPTPQGEGYWDERERPVWVWGKLDQRPKMVWQKKRVWVLGKKPSTEAPPPRRKRAKRRRKRRR